MVERSHWSDSTADARAWLDALPLCGGGADAAALAEGLADVLFLLAQAAAAQPAPPSVTGQEAPADGAAADNATGSMNGGMSGGDGGGVDGGSGGSGVSQQVVLVARTEPHRLAIPWPFAEDISPQVGWCDMAQDAMRNPVQLRIHNTLSCGLYTRNDSADVASSRQCAAMAPAAKNKYVSVLGGRHG